MKKNSFWSKWLSALLFGIILIAVYKTFDNFNTIFSVITGLIGLFTPFIIGIILAFFLYPACSKVEEMLARSKKHWVSAHAHGIGTLSVYFSALALLVAAITFLIPKLSASITDLLENLPAYLNEIKVFLESLAARGGIFQYLDVEQIMQVLNVQTWFSDLVLGDVGQYVEGVKGFTSTLMTWFLGIVICAYTLLEKESLIKLVRKLFGFFLKRETLDKTGFYLVKISRIFYRFFFGKAVDSIIVGVVATIGFYLLGVPFPLVMGVIIIIFNMVPYFGPIIGAIPVVFVALLVKGVSNAVWAAVFLLVLQQLDANVLGPKIIGDSVGVSPFWVIFAILVFGGLFGVWGMVFGVPLVAAIRLIMLDYMDDGKINISPQALRKGIKRKMEAVGEETEEDE